MKILLKKMLMQTGSFVVGVGMIAANGVFMLTQKQPNIEHAEPIPPAADTVATETQAVYKSSATLENSAVQTISAADLPKASTYEKASLDDYRLLIKIDRKTSKKEKKKSDGSGDKFDVAYELDTTKIYDPKPDPINFTDTRDVSAEYYTVDDIISGSHVTLNARELLCRMVYSEIGDGWDEDAIKAQVVASYSYLRFNDAVGLTPTVGLKTGYSAKIENCVKAVEGQAVYYDGEIINAVYSASTAGYSTESDRIWDVYYPYLRCVVSEFDNEDPNYGLESEYTKDEVREMLSSALDITLSDDVTKWFALTDIYCGRYVGYVDIDGQVTIPARKMEEIFDLKSQAFTISYEEGVFHFKTYGWGHGVGMSQWGACYYAKHGYTYDQILRHYYLNTELGLSRESSKAVSRGEAYNTPDTPDIPEKDDNPVNTEPPQQSDSDSSQS